MLCGNCNNQINDQELFCGNCGVKIIYNNNIENNPELEPTIKTKVSIKEKIIKNKKKLIIIFSIIAVFLIGKTVFKTLYDPIVLKWDEDFKKNEITNYIKNEVELKILALDGDKKPFKELNYKVSGGIVRELDKTIIWELPDENGSYTIEVKTNKYKKITKKINYLKEEHKNLAGLMLDEPENLDSDNDGLLDKEEKKLGTNPFDIDTDKDGLTDDYEIKIGTDPLKKDTDGDGLLDGVEHELGLDPLKSSTDGINKDGDLTNSYKTRKEDFEVLIEGKGNISNIVLTKYENRKLLNEGYLDNIYRISKPESKSLTVNIYLDSKELERKKISKEKIGLYKMETSSSKLIELEYEFDLKSLVITAKKLKGDEKLVVADKEKVNEEKETKILFSLDNSVSMYNESQMIEMGYNNSVGAVGNDPAFKRVNFTKTLINKMPEEYTMSVNNFAGNVVELSGFINNKSQLGNSLDKLTKDLESGTNIVNSLETGLGKFTDKTNNFIVLLTDGADTSGRLNSNKRKIIEKANLNNVTICTIGLGTTSYSEELSEISRNTGCNFYYAENTLTLDEIYKEIASKINNGIIDTDNDGENDGQISLETNFITTKDGFAFKNFATEISPGGNCFGMATFAYLNYLEELPKELPDLNKKGIIMQSGHLFQVKATGYKYYTTKNFFKKGNKSNYNLYNYEFDNNALRYLFHNENNGIEVRDLSANIKETNQTAYFTTEMKKTLDSIGADYSFGDIKDKLYPQYIKRETASLNLSSEKFKNIKTDDTSTLNAINRLFHLQAIFKRVKLKDNPEIFIERLKSDIKNDIPTVLNIKLSERGGHAVNATKIIYNDKESDNFKIEIYDNNYPGGPQYIEVTTHKIANKDEYYYTFEYDGYDMGNDVSINNIELE